MTHLSPAALFEQGYGDLISITPPKATLSPNSKLAANSLGKAPGVKYANGTWGGYNWRKHATTLADVQKWLQDGANIGLRAGSFPGLDIDSMNESVVTKVRELAEAVLGPAPVRTGKAPKCLLMYRTDAPFTRMRMWLEGETQSHLIELLGEGQQYLVYGTHPATMRPYSWDAAVPDAKALVAITPEKVELLFARVKQHFTEMGFTVKREGDGRKRDRTSVTDQTSLIAPSIESLQAAVAAVPNNDAFKTREEWLKMGYAIRAACGDELEEGYNVFADWCERWDGGENDADYVEQNWRRFHPPFGIGWSWIAEKARAFGYNDAPDDFPADPNAIPQAAPGPQRVRMSDVWLADNVVEEIGDRLRYVSARGAWYVWNGSQWVPDATEEARYAVLTELRRIAAEEIASGANASGPALRQIAKDARHIESASSLSNIMALIRADRTVSVAVDALDADPWTLNTPMGVVNLKDGTVTPGLPEQLHTKTTRVGPQAGSIAEWARFLMETTGQDVELVMYLQRLAGYCLTGLTVEHSLDFIWGPGGNGKSVFMNALSEVMGDYATVAGMDVFTASNMDRHTTDLADLMGARLVAASETQAGRRWDEQRLKLLSSGDRVKARFMRQDNVTYRPTFKLLFVGNHQPHIRNLDEAMRRRIHMVPFTRKPAVRDPYLGEKLRAEYPGILAWMIQGCLAWQKQGLNPPDAVSVQTDEYFDAEDVVGQWIEERCDVGEHYESNADVLFQSWREWCGENNERAPGRKQDLVQALKARHFEHYKHGKTRRSMFRGIAVNKAADMEAEE